ncbi:GGDEF domain-containing protein [Halalkalibacillus sediminis]|nr:GGDEF domain-containing protein [Halalkalibacillus sediminis]
MTKIYMNDFQTEQLFSIIRWLFLAISAALFYLEPFSSQLNFNTNTFFYLIVFAFCYMFMTQVFLFFRLKRERIQRNIMKFGIICDYIAIMWLIALSGGIESPFVPVVFLLIMHATIYWSVKGLSFSIVASALGYAAIGIGLEQFYQFSLVWEFAFNTMFFIIIGFFAGVLAYRERLHYQDKMNYQDQSLKDYVTDLYNHRSFQNTLEKLTSTQKNISMMMIDIDDFKQVNDRFGHTLGDQVLYTLGNTFKTNLPKSQGYCFRYGGEEFSIILFETEKSALEKQIKNWNQHFEQSVQMIPELKDYQITLSYGVTKYQSTDTKQSMLKRADRNLYYAKENGKNRAVFDETFER